MNWHDGRLDRSSVKYQVRVSATLNFRPLKKGNLAAQPRLNVGVTVQVIVELITCSTRYLWLLSFISMDPSYNINVGISYSFQRIKKTQLMQSEIWNRCRKFQLPSNFTVQAIKYSSPWGNKDIGVESTSQHKPTWMPLIRLYSA